LSCVAPSLQISLGRRAGVHGSTAHTTYVTTQCLSLAYIWVGIGMRYETGKNSRWIISLEDSMYLAQSL
jgi:hypothetical protein